MAVEESASRAGLRATVAPKEAYDLLVLLATDDLFRERLEANPVDVFAERGLYITGDFARERITLPPKENVQQALETYDREGAFEFDVSPLGSGYRPAQAPFIFLLALAALV